MPKHTHASRYYRCTYYSPRLRRGLGNVLCNVVFVATSVVFVAITRSVESANDIRFIGNKKDDCVRKSVCVPTVYANKFPKEAQELREIAIKTNVWTQNRHDFYPTRDVPIEMLGFRASELAFDVIWGSMKARIEKQCGLAIENDEKTSDDDDDDDEEEEEDDEMEEENHKNRTRKRKKKRYELTISDAFVIRYDGSVENESHLQKHQDGGPISFQVSLSNADEYEGGGTNFYEAPKRRTAAEAAANVSNVRLKQNVKLEKIGDVIAHGGQIDHEGEKVTRGVRYTLVYFLDINKGCCWEHTLSERMNKIMQRVGVLVILFLAFLFARSDQNGFSTTKTKTKEDKYNL